MYISCVHLTVTLHIKHAGESQKKVCRSYVSRSLCSVIKSVAVIQDEIGEGSGQGALSSALYGTGVLDAR